MLKNIRSYRKLTPTAPPEQINWLDFSTHRKFLTEPKRYVNHTLTLWLSAIRYQLSGISYQVSAIRKKLTLFDLLIADS